MAEAKHEKSVFEVLNAVNVSDKTDKKNGLTYLPWAYAWGEVLKKYPDTTYTVVKTPEGMNYWTDGKTCWVEVSVTIEGKTLTEMLSVMDYRNTSIPKDKVTSVDVIKSIQRCATKCIARFGLGLYVYAGEDLPEEETIATEPKRGDICSFCKKPITDYNDKYTKAVVIEESLKQLGKPVCMTCWMAKAKAKKEAENNAK